MAAAAATGTASCAAATTPVASGSPATSWRAVLVGSVEQARGYAVNQGFTAHPEQLSGTLPVAAPATSCAEYAAGSPGTGGGKAFVAPEFDTGGPTGVYVQVDMTSGYSGPGRYDSRSFPRLQGYATFAIPPVSAPQFDTFRSAFYGWLVLTVGADGSGSVSVQKWGSSGSDSVVSGSISWSCRPA